MVFFQDDEDALSVYRNLKFFCETAPKAFVVIVRTNKLRSQTSLHIDQRYILPINSRGVGFFPLSFSN